MVDPLNAVIGIGSTAMTLMSGAIGHLYIKLSALQKKEALCQKRLAVLESEHQHTRAQLASFEGAGYVGSCIIKATMPEGKIIDASAGVQSLLGYSLEDLRGRNVDTVIPEEFRKRHHRAIDKASEVREINRGTLGVEAFALHKHGMKIPVIVTLRESSRDPWEVEAQIDRRRV